MKYLKSPNSIVAFCFACALLSGIPLLSSCGTTPQRTTFNTIGAAEVTASAAVDGYYTAVINKVAGTNQVPQVSQAFNQFQAAATLAATLDQAGTNAIAPAALNTELTQLLSLVATLVPTK